MTNDDDFAARLAEADRKLQRDMRRLNIAAVVAAVVLAVALLVTR